MNKVVLMGRLTKKPEVRYTSGTTKAVCNFTLAVNRKVSKEKDRQADFIDLVAWDGTAELLEKHCPKGMQIAVVGSLQKRAWDDSEGKRHYITEVVAKEVYFADGKRDGRGERIEEAFEGGSDGFYPMDDDDFHTYR